MLLNASVITSVFHKDLSFKTSWTHIAYYRLLLPGFSVKGCRLQNWEKMGLWMWIKNYKSTVYKMELIWSTLDDLNPSCSHLTLPSQPSFDWILHLQVHTLLIDSGRRYVSLDADKGILQPFLFHVSMQKTSKPNWEGTKERNREADRFWMEMMAWKSIPNFQSTN